MRYRKQDENGDYVFGQPNAAEFWVNVAEGVAQALRTRLLLIVGEWFLDLNEGMPWDTQVLGTNTSGLYDQALQDRVLGTQGVESILAYNSSLDRATRVLTVTMTVQTIYGGTITITAPYSPLNYLVDDQGRRIITDGGLPFIVVN